MSSHPNQQSAPPDDWQAARGDEVVRLARRLKGRKNRRQFLRAGGGVAGGVLALASGWWAVRATVGARAYDFGGISCSQVVALTDNWLQGNLPEEQAARVAEHVALCPICKPKFEQMGQEKLVRRAMPVRRRTDVA